MKKILNILLGLLFVGLSAQTTTVPSGVSTTENYVYSRTYLEAVTASDSTAKQVQGIQYFDGLGRPKQSIAIKASPLGRDVVTPVVYDGFGRQTRDYLPIPQSSTTNGTIYTQNTGLVNYPVSDPTNIYSSEKIYSEKVLESSPLNRVLQQVQVGNDWSSKPIKFDYLTNIGDAVKKYTITTTWAVANTDVYTTTSSLPVISTYADNNLYKNKVTDEDGNISYEFKNGQGQTLLVRKVLSATQNADTYYVYNEYDQLALVIPPLAAAKTTLIQSDLDELCYQYRYDNQNRLVEKKLPGKGWEFLVYDKQDRLVLSQDAMLRGTTNNFAKRGWLFTKYDQFGRVVYTGFFANTATRETMQKSLNSMSSNAANNESRNSTGFSQNGLTVYYTKVAFPTGSMTILSVNYYDQYPTDLATIPTTIQGETLLTTTPQAPEQRSLKSLSVASFVKNIDTDSWTKSYSFYDLKGRAIGSHSYNYLGGYTKAESKLDFAGVPQESYTYHKRLSTDTEIIIKERFEYDGQNRMVKHWHNVNNAANDELLTFNEYNELGQLKNKKVGGITGSQLQSVDYRYNIRGWMTGINLDATGNVQTNKLFSYKIGYQEPLQITTTKPYLANQSLEVKPKYNGNISEITWFSGTDSTEPIKKYGYVYDGLNRLTAGFYYKKSGTSYLFTEENNEIPEYDLNGNISKLKRFAYLVGTTPNKIDDLAYSYTGNRLINLSDAGNSSGYENASTLPIQYDSNGNMTEIPGKNIQKINYNYLNLPKSIFLAYGDNISYAYRADGVKIGKVFTSTILGGNNMQTIIKNTIDHLDGFQYKTEETTTTGEGVIDTPVPELPKGTKPLAMEQEAFLDVSLDSGEPLVEEPRPILQFFPTAEGFYDYQKNLYIYQYKDHLGNTRLSYSKNPTTGSVEVQDQNDYYPFGMNHLKTGVAYFGTGTWNNYKYNGKELQETGMYDYGARFYMPDIGRWGVVDPLAEKSTRFSPYAYAYNNPIRFIDPDGRYALPPNDSGGFKNGQIWTDNDGSWERVDGGWKSKTNGQSSVIDEVTLKGKAGGGYVSFDKTYGKGGASSYHAMSTGFNANGDYAGFDSNLTMGGASYTNNTGDGALPLAVDLGGEASVMSSSVSARLGTVDNGIFGNANGSMWSANANLSGGAFTGEGQKYGLLLDANAGAQAFKGEYTGGISIFGITVQGTAGGTFGSAHIGGTAGAYYDGNNGTFNIKVQENIGLGVGEKGAIEIKIPVPFIKK